MTAAFSLYKIASNDLHNNEKGLPAINDNSEFVTIINRDQIEARYEKYHRKMQKILHSNPRAIPALTYVVTSDFTQLPSTLIHQQRVLMCEVNSRIYKFGLENTIQTPVTFPFANGMLNLSHKMQELKYKFTFHKTI